MHHTSTPNHNHQATTNPVTCKPSLLSELKEQDRERIYPKYLKYSDLILWRVESDDRYITIVLPDLLSGTFPNNVTQHCTYSAQTRPAQHCTLSPLSVVQPAPVPSTASLGLSEILSKCTRPEQGIFSDNLYSSSSRF